MPRYAIGVDYGAESVHVLIVDIRDGRIAGQGADAYRHGVIDRTLPASGAALPHDYALQHPQDWIDSLAIATKQAMAAAKVSPADVAYMRFTDHWPSRRRHSRRRRDRCVILRPSKIITL